MRIEASIAVLALMLALPAPAAGDHASGHGHTGDHGKGAAIGYPADPAEADRTI